MITCNLMGGLGNQLFQIFTTIAYGIKSNNPFKFLNVDKLGGGSTTIRYTFWKSFLNKLNIFLINEIPQDTKVIRENGFPFNKLSILSMVNKNIMLYGYFQSYKYFEDHYNIICKVIGIDNIRQELLDKLKYDNKFLENTVSIHFRIGDYKKIPEYHPILSKKYYLNSLNFIKQKYPDKNFNIMYFCENDDIDDVIQTINFLQSYFTNLNFIRVEENLEDWEQMMLMSSCHHNIIANSSFSWWGAYFNNWNDKVVCYPSEWFGPVANHDTRDLCPKHWVQIYV